MGKLLNAQKKENLGNNKIDKIVNLALIAIGLSMGVCIIVTSILKQIDTNCAFTMLVTGLSCFGIYLLKNKDNK